MSILIPILLVGTALAGARGYRLDAASDFGMRGWPAAIFMAGAVVLPLLWLWLMTRLCDRRLNQGGGMRYLVLSDRALSAAQWSIMIGYVAAVIVFGWGRTVQIWLGGAVIFIDVFLTLLPALFGITLTWAIHYPVIQRIRHATVLRALDEGRTVHEVPSRWRFVLVQMRANVLFLLVPLLLIVLTGDLADRLFPPDPADDGVVRLNEAVAFGCAVLIFLFAPAIARLLLDVRSMPPGEVRADLLRVCDEQRVRVRDVLLWRTDGSMINAAVMGLIAPLRYVLITDALLESMRRDEVLAVMAHEVGHVRRRHIPWMIVALLAVLMTPWLGFAWAAREFGMPQLDNVGMGATAVVAFFAFGWISRRFERQADTFAVQHLSGMRPGNGGRNDLGDEVRPEAALAMQSALESVARLNGMNPRKRSWRHGSIRWRQAHLARIVGEPLRALSIDRQIQLIKIASLLVFVGSIITAELLDRRFRAQYLNDRTGSAQVHSESHEHRASAAGAISSASDHPLHRRRHTGVDVAR